METVRVVNHMGKLNLLGQIAICLFVLGIPDLAAAQADSFDVPLKKTVVHLGQSPYYHGGNVWVKLSCYFLFDIHGQRIRRGTKRCRVVVDCSGRCSNGINVYAVSCCS
jgi:hypothetical protein